jgi:hypothetical protein
MLSNDNIFAIDASTAHSELEKIHKEIVKNIDKIKTIEIKQDEDIKSSALLSLLVSIKNSKPEIGIPLIDEQNNFLKGLGKFSIVK